MIKSLGFCELLALMFIYLIATGQQTGAAAFIFVAVLLTVQRVVDILRSSLQYRIYTNERIKHVGVSAKTVEGDGPEAD